MTLIDGKKVADDIKREIAAEVDNMVAAGMRRPHLAAILVGHDGGSETYVDKQGQGLRNVRVQVHSYPL